MSIVNALLTGFFDGLLYPFRELPELVGLLVVSVLTAIGLLLIFKATSNQKGIAAVKRRIHAGVFEIRLFNDDFRAILRAQREILRHNLTYLRLSIIPMLWTIPPLILVLVHLQFHYGYGGLRSGTRAIVKVELNSSTATDLSKSFSKPDVQLETSPGLRVDSPPVWIPSLREMAWRIAVDEAGDYRVKILMNGETFTKTVRVSTAVVRRSPIRLQKGFVNQLLYPAEDPLPNDSAIKSISVTYPENDIGVFGLDLHWIVVYFVLSTVFAFALRRPFKVNI